MSRAFVVLTLVFRKDGRVWTAECRELGTATYARSLGRAHAELVELVDLHLNTLEETGERQHFFRTHGIQVYADEHLPAEVTSTVPIGDDDAYVHAHPFVVNAVA